jgi:hypothetical protein
MSPAKAFAGAQYVDASHGVFNEAGRDIINYNSYQLVSRTCSLVDIQSPITNYSTGTASDNVESNGEFFV